MTPRAPWAAPGIGWAARFDGQALQPYAEAPGLAMPDGAGLDWPALRQWCLADPGRRLALARPDSSMPGAAAADLAAALALQLDGTLALRECRHAAARLALRLRVKWQDLVHDTRGAGALPASRIWDSGRARGDVAALARFRPRRPSFIVIDSGAAAGWSPALAALQQDSATWAFPVRLLWLLPDAAPVTTDWLPLP